MRKIIFIALVFVLIILSGIGCKSYEYYVENQEANITTNPEMVIVEPITVIEEPKYTNEELDLLARVIWCEAGSDWLTDEHQKAVASVVVNRVNDDRFPNTIKEVVYQPGQYGCVYNGMIYQTPNQRAYDNARYILENGVTIPTNVVWQAKSAQGNGLYKYIQGHYFCH